MSQPVAAALAFRGVRCRILSLCEFRGLKTPAEAPPAELCQVVPMRFRSPSSSLPTTGSSRTAGRGLKPLAKGAAWSLLLERPLRRRWRSAWPDLVVLPNDAAYPYDRIVALLGRLDIPFVLLQEGIRFPLPGVTEEDAYGRGDANAIAAWGESSAAYFRATGVHHDAIHVTGSPRFDHLVADRPALADEGPLVLLSNPIDDQGFCTKVGKLDLLEEFARGAAPLFEDPTFRLVIKLHAREDPEEVRQRLSDVPHTQRIEVTVDAPLHDLLRSARGAVVLASTVGLEALLLGVPLAVLEIPHHGFVFDYVESGGAYGLSRRRELATQVREWLADPPTAATYIDQALAHHGRADEEVASLIERLADRPFEKAGFD